MKKRLHKKGQAMVEACIGMALICFVWVTIWFMTYMANNQIKTAMAARHAAWQVGNGATPSEAAIVKNFFYNLPTNMSLVKINAGYPPLGIGGLIGDIPDPPPPGGGGHGHGHGHGGGGGDEDEIDMGLADGITGNGPFAVEIKFGVEADMIGKTNLPLPFAYLDVDFPYMPKSNLWYYMEARTVCQWEEVHDTWQSGLIDVLGNLLSEVLGDIGF